jgi:hypothetical protein
VTAGFVLLAGLAVVAVTVVGVRSAYARELASLGVTIAVLGGLIALALLSTAVLQTMIGSAAL